MSAVLTAHGLTKRFGDRLAVDDVSFTINPGETYGLLGPNGAGKTTTISMVSGLLAADAGSVSILGEEMSPRRAAPKRHLGLVPQELAIYPDLSAHENLAYFGRLQGLRGRELRQRIDEVLEVIGLQDRARGATKTFSGGMKRRLNIGIALLHSPQLLILDEPTVGVDPQSRNAILESVERLATQGMAVLYTTHYMEEAERLCDRIGIIDSGRLQAEGSHLELVSITGGHDRIRLTGSGETEAAVRALRELPAVREAESADGEVWLTVQEAPTTVAAVIGAATGAGMQLRDVEISRPSLESVFLHLTGKALRD